MYEVLGQRRQHGQAAGHVETADANRNVLVEEGPRQIDGARKLIGLNAHECDQRLVSGPDRFEDFGRRDTLIGFVEGGDDDVCGSAEHLALAAILGDAVEAGKRVRGNRRQQPLNRVAIVVVMGGLNHDKVECRLTAHKRILRKR